MLLLILFCSYRFYIAEGAERAAANLDVTGAGEKKKRIIKVLKHIFSFFIIAPTL
jgi:hypothetical protein